MVHPKKNKVQLSDADVKKLKRILMKKDTSQTIANRCRILLALDELPADLLRRAITVGPSDCWKNRQRLNLMNLSAGKQSEDH